MGVISDKMNSVLGQKKTGKSTLAQKIFVSFFQEPS